MRQAGLRNAVAGSLPNNRRWRPTNCTTNAAHINTLQPQAGNHDALLEPELLVAPSSFHLDTSSGGEVLQFKLEAAHEVTSAPDREARGEAGTGSRRRICSNSAQPRAMVLASTRHSPAPGPKLRPRELLGTV